MRHIDWDDAPEWAAYGAVDGLGNVYWFRKCPRYKHTGREWLSVDGEEPVEMFGGAYWEPRP